MAIWGVHSFDNDDASEWCQAYREMGLFVAKSTMEVALGDFKNGALQADVASRAVAAVEAVAFALGRGSDEANAAFQGAPVADKAEAAALVPLATDTLAAVIGGSGVSAYWSETTDHDKWLASITELEARVSGVEAAPEAVGAADTPPPPAGERAPAGDDIQAELSRLTAEIQNLREEMRSGLVELARLVGAQNR